MLSSAVAGRVGSRAVTEDCCNGGIVGLRSRLDALRETVIVSLTGRGGQASLWGDMYDVEPGCMERQPRAASLPGNPAIEVGWSVLLPEGSGG